MVDNDALQAQLAVIRAAFIEELPQRRQRIQDAWERYQQGGSEESQQEFHREVHSLAGAGATFGCDELSKRAKAVEQQFKVFTEAAEYETDAELLTLYDQLLTEIQQVCDGAAKQ